MPITAVEIPVSLLQAPDLTASTKLVWAVLRFGPANPARLEQRSGLSRRTVLTGLNRLAGRGWSKAVGDRWAAVDGLGEASPSVSLPAGLLGERGLGANAKLLYGVLQITPGLRKAKGQTTYAELARLAGIDDKTARSSARALVEAGWLTIDQVNQIVSYNLLNPEAQRRRAELTELRHRLRKGQHQGETLMREFLTLLVDRADFRDEDDPEFLTNPETGERLRFDRFYPPGVAFEHNGRQHYQETELFTREESNRQQVRDLIKLGICARRGITMVVVHAEDLTLETMRRKIGDLLPLRDLAGHEAVVKLLKEETYDYRLGAKEGAQKGPARRRDPQSRLHPRPQQRQIPG